jgi:hypothetical protein
MSDLSDCVFYMPGAMPNAHAGDRNYQVLAKAPKITINGKEYDDIASVSARL